jgi:hypothetical protein
MIFEKDVRHDSLYQMDFGALMISVCAKWLSADLDETGGIVDLIYTIEIEHSTAGEVDYHLLIVPKKSLSNAQALSVDNLSDESVRNSVKRFNQTFASYNVFGQSVCSYTIDCSSTFNSDGILIDRNHRTRIKTVEGYTCSNSFVFTAGSIDESTFNEFAWKWAYTSGNMTLENRGYEETGSGVHGLK